MKRKLFYVLSTAAVVLALASCGETKDEKQIKTDLAGKSNQEVVDYVAKQAVSEAAVSKIQDTKGVKATLKEKFKASEKMGDTQELNAEGEATAEFVFEYEKGLSLKGSATGTVKGKYDSNKIDAKATASAEVYYSIAEDTIYLNAKAEVKGTNGTTPLDQKVEYKGKIPNVSEYTKEDVEEETPDTGTTTTPNVTTNIPSVTLTPEYYELLNEVTKLVEEYRSKLTYTIEDNQVKIGLDTTKEDIKSLLKSELVAQIIRNAGVDSKIFITIGGVLAAESTKINSSTKVGFTKDYLLKSVSNELDIAVSFDKFNVSVESSTNLDFDFGNYSSEDVKDKDSYTEIIEIPSSPSEII